MLKAALLCSAICTAFVVGGPPSASSPDNPAKAVKPGSLREVIKPFIGKNCLASVTAAGRWLVSFEAKYGKKRSFKLDMLGVDFIRVSKKGVKVYIPFSSIYTFNSD